MGITINALEMATGTAQVICYQRGSKGMKLVGILHTHPMDGNSIFSTFDFATSAQFGGSIFAVQDGKFLILDAGEFQTPKEHHWDSGPMDIILHSTSTYGKDKYYRS